MSFLRRSVSVEFGDDAIRLAHAFWSIQLDPECVLRTPGLQGFLERAAPVSSVAADQPQVANLISLFRAAGLLTVEKKAEYELREIAELFEPLCTTWHALYYSHPIWGRLRHGDLSRNALLAWMLHNYHLSRSAGVTAARCASYCNKTEIRKVFLASALEEYPHCEEYYFIDDSRLGISHDQVQSYVPLRASLSFDQHMLRLAEEDWLAHILVGYFQESTAAFYGQCCLFYQEVEERYGLPGFFESWKGHIRLDHDLGHASAFLDVLDSGEKVSAPRLEASLHNTLLTAQLLVEALDEIMGEERSGQRMLLRRPLTEDPTCFEDNALVIHALPRESGWDLTKCRSVGEILSELSCSGILSDVAVSESQPATEDFTFLESELAASICRALSYAKEHEEIVRLGRLLEAAEPLLSRKDCVLSCCPPTIWSAGVSNFIRELAHRPAALVLCINLSMRWSSDLGYRLEFIEAEEVKENLRALMSFYIVPAGERGLFATLAVQFRELWRATTASAQRLSIDVFTEVPYRISNDPKLLADTCRRH